MKLSFSFFWKFLLWFAWFNVATCLLDSALQGSDLLLPWVESTRAALPFTSIYSRCVPLPYHSVTTWRARWSGLVPATQPWQDMSLTLESQKLSRRRTWQWTMQQENLSVKKVRQGTREKGYRMRSAISSRITGSTLLFIRGDIWGHERNSQHCPSHHFYEQPSALIRTTCLLLCPGVTVLSALSFRCSSHSGNQQVPTIFSEHTRTGRNLSSLSYQNKMQKSSPALGKAAHLLPLVQQQTRGPPNSPQDKAGTSVFMICSHPWFLVAAITNGRKLRDLTNTSVWLSSCADKSEVAVTELRQGISKDVLCSGRSGTGDKEPIP